MPGRPRNTVIREDVVGVYHVWDRCIRQTWLCGVDRKTGRNYEHRKQWISDRLQELVQIFAIDACVFAILSNHYHLLLRNRVDLAAQWSDEEVVRRWWQLFPERRDEYGKPAVPTELELSSLLSDPQFVAERRRRLSSISWFMKCLNEPIAKRANAEDDAKGHFFQDRFGCRNLLDEGAILACAIYIDLNEIKALIAKSLEDSKNTSAYLRILARLKRQLASEELPTNTVSALNADDPDYWLCPVHEQDCAPLLGPDHAESVEASNEIFCNAHAAHVPPVMNNATVFKLWRHGFLSTNVDEYLKFLDWNVEHLLNGRKDDTEVEAPSILNRLGMTATFWLKMVDNFELWFHGAAGSSEKLAELASLTGRKWIQGIGPMRGALG